MNDPSRVSSVKASRLREQIKSAVASHRIEHALFLGDILLALTAEASDALLYADTMFAAGEFARAVHLLKRCNLITTARPQCPDFSPLAARGSVVSVLLGARCLEKLNEWNECLDLLGESEVDLEHGDHTSSIFFLRGKCCEMLERRSEASNWYRRALQCQPAFTEAFERLSACCPVDSSFIDSLQFSEDDEYIRDIYVARSFSQTNPQERTNQALARLTQYGLANSTSVMLIDAKLHSNKFDWNTAVKITTKLSQVIDPFNNECVLNQLCVLVELKKKADLFALAHNLVQSRPNSALSWFSVGCYYYSMGMYDKSCRYLEKSTQIDPRFVSAWIVFGHSYSHVEESDQSMAAYRHVARLMPGHHVGNLLIGMEHIKCGHLDLAYELLHQCLHTNANDPILCNELGVIFFKRKQYEQALGFFEKAALSCPKSIAFGSEWEFPLFNLGTTLRKLRRYPEALSCYERCLAVAPQSASTLTAIAFINHLMGQLDEAINYYHKALGFQTNSNFCLEMMNQAIRENYCNLPDHFAVQPLNPHASHRPLHQTFAWANRAPTPNPTPSPMLAFTLPSPAPGVHFSSSCSSATNAPNSPYGLPSPASVSSHISTSSVPGNQRAQQPTVPPPAPLRALPGARPNDSPSPAMDSEEIGEGRLSTSSIATSRIQHRLSFSDDMPSPFHRM